MSCERAAQVHAYHDRQLGPAAREAMAAHLAECAECAALLGDVRAVSERVRAAPLPDVGADVSERYYAAWDVSRQRGILRVSSWLTGAAAAVLLGSLLLLPQGAATSTGMATGGAATSAWEPVALMPPPERLSDRPDELIEVAQWMADDLSVEGIR